jgi:hypothetical protein
MSEPTASATKLDQHMALIGQVTARFVSKGLLGQPIDTFAPESFLGAPADPRTFEAVITWMLDEGIIRGKEPIQTIDGRLRIQAVQLTSKGLAIVQQPLPEGDNIAKRIQSHTGGNAFWSNIGELVWKHRGQLHEIDEFWLIASVHRLALIRFRPSD